MGASVSSDIASKYKPYQSDDILAQIERTVMGYNRRIETTLKSSSYSLFRTIPLSVHQICIEYYGKICDYFKLAADGCRINFGLRSVTKVSYEGGYNNKTFGNFMAKSSTGLNIEYVWSLRIDKSKAGRISVGISSTNGDIYLYHGFSGYKFDRHGSNMYGDKFGEGDEILIHFSSRYPLKESQLTFYKNGKSQGVAFHGSNFTFLSTYTIVVVLLDIDDAVSIQSFVERENMHNL